eukprot:403365027
MLQQVTPITGYEKFDQCNKCGKEFLNTFMLNNTNSPDNNPHNPINEDQSYYNQDAVNISNSNSNPRKLRSVKKGEQNTSSFILERSYCPSCQLTLNHQNGKLGDGLILVGTGNSGHPHDQNMSTALLYNDQTTMIGTKNEISSLSKMSPNVTMSSKNQHSATNGGSNLISNNLIIQESDEYNVMEQEDDSMNQNSKNSNNRNMQVLNVEEAKGGRRGSTQKSGFGNSSSHQQTDSINIMSTATQMSNYKQSRSQGRQAKGSTGQFNNSKHQQQYQKKQSENLCKRFEFIQETRSVNYRVQQLSEEERRRQELELYDQLKLNKQGQYDSDGSVLYYIIDGNWLQQWKYFIKSRGPLPQEIDNSSLRNYILQWRQSQQNYQNIDNEMEIQKRQDYFELDMKQSSRGRQHDEILVSQESIFESQIIQDEFQNNVYQNDHVNETLNRTDEEKRIVGKLYTSIRAVPKYNFTFLKMGLEDRIRNEHEMFNKLQNMNPSSKRQFYLVSNEWVNDWFKFAQKNHKLQYKPPGPILNDFLEQELVINENFDKLKKNQDYFLFTKDVWEFFFNIYGGGPVISINNPEDRLNATYISEAGSNKFEIQSVTSSNFSYYRSANNFGNNGQNNTSMTQGYTNQNLSVTQTGQKVHKNLIDLSDGIVGIRNINYYCYLNAFMQCLVPLNEMRDHFLTQEYAKYKSVTTKRDDFSFSNGLYLFYKNVFRSKNKTIEIKFLKDVVAKKFHPIMQHDSHEFMMFLFGSLQDEETPVEGSQFNGSDQSKSLDQILREYYRAHPSIVDRLFSGMQKTVVTCGKCQNQSNTYNPYMALSVQFEQNLQQSIQSFLKEDMLDNSDTFPKMKKIKGMCQYPEHITMKEPNLRSNSPGATENVPYELFGLTIHIGSLEMGHYVAYSKRQGQWYKFNDEDVREVSQKEAFSQEAYLLFYQRVQE